MGRPPRNANAVDTPTRILASALSVFGRDGFARANLAEIAAGAGIRRPSLLYHFASKEALYQAVVEGAFGRLGAGLGEVMVRGPAPFSDRVRDLARTFAADLASHPDDARLIVRELLSEEGPGHAILMDQVIPLLNQVVSFLEREAQGSLRLPVRAVVLQIVAHVLLQASAREPLRGALWGAPDPDETWALARTLFNLEA